MPNKILLVSISVLVIFTVLSADWYLQHSGVRMLYGIDFPPNDITNGYTCGVSYLGLKTTNSGSTWDTMAMQTTGDYQDINFPVNAQIGYAVSDFGYVAKTEDSGHTWLVVNIGSTNRLYGVHFPTDNQLGFVVGANGVACYTVDGGMNWINMTTPFPFDLYDVHFMNPEFGLAVGANGKILVSYGIDWTAQNSGTTEALFGVDIVPDGSVAWVVGANNTCLKSTDLGTTWERLTNLPLPAQTRLNSVFFLDANTGYICGSGGIILKTTNGGSNWDTTRVAGGEDLYKIVFPARDSIGWVCGAREAIYSTIPVGIQEINSKTNPIALIAHPNPFRQSTVIKCTNPTKSTALLKIYNSAGSLVRTLTVNKNGIAHWDGSDTKNQKVRAGIYLLEIIEQGNVTHRLKLVQLD
jgi:photosystem II stability/assembly factor-like uncharacterized protein